MEIPPAGDDLEPAKARAGAGAVVATSQRPRQEEKSFMVGRSSPAWEMTDTTTFVIVGDVGRSAMSEILGLSVARLTQDVLKCKTERLREAGIFTST